MEDLQSDLENVLLTPLFIESTRKYLHYNDNVGDVMSLETASRNMNTTLDNLEVIVKQERLDESVGQLTQLFDKLHRCSVILSDEFASIGTQTEVENDTIQTQTDGDVLEDIRPLSAIDNRLMRVDRKIFINQDVLEKNNNSDYCYCWDTSTCPLTGNVFVIGRPGWFGFGLIMIIVLDDRLLFVRLIRTDMQTIHVPFISVTHAGHL